MLTANRTNEIRRRNEALTEAHPVKLTALQYICEALIDERYEEMEELVGIAKEFGAGYWELRTALTRENFEL